MSNKLLLALLACTLHLSADTWRTDTTTGRPIYERAVQGQVLHWKMDTGIWHTVPMPSFQNAQPGEHLDFLWDGQRPYAITPSQYQHPETRTRVQVGDLHSFPGGVQAWVWSPPMELPYMTQILCASERQLLVVLAHREEKRGRAVCRERQLAHVDLRNNDVRVLESIRLLPNQYFCATGTLVNGKGIAVLSTGKCYTWEPLEAGLTPLATDLFSALSDPLTTPLPDDLLPTPQFLSELSVGPKGELIIPVDITVDAEPAHVKAHWEAEHPLRADGTRDAEEPRWPTTGRMPYHWKSVFLQLDLAEGKVSLLPSEQVAHLFKGDQPMCHLKGAHPDIFLADTQGRLAHVSYDQTLAEALRSGAKAQSPPAPRDKAP